MSRNLTEQEQMRLLSLYGTTDHVVADLARRIAVLESLVLEQAAEDE